MAVGRKWTLAVLALGLCGGLGASACPGASTRPPVEEILLERQRQGLLALLEDAKADRLLPFDQVLFVVQQSLVQRLIEATLPYEQVLPPRYKIRVERARVEFEDGFALV